ncbi:hypothetical protein [Azospirillum argentinense]
MRNWKEQFFVIAGLYGTAASLVSAHDFDHGTKLVLQYGLPTALIFLYYSSIVIRRIFFYVNKSSAFKAASEVVVLYRYGRFRKYWAVETQAKGIQLFSVSFYYFICANLFSVTGTLSRDDGVLFLFNFPQVLLIGLAVFYIFLGVRAFAPLRTLPEVRRYRAIKRLRYRLSVLGFSENSDGKFSGEVSQRLAKIDCGDPLFGLYDTYGFPRRRRLRRKILNVAKKLAKPISV